MERVFSGLCHVLLSQFVLKYRIVWNSSVGLSLIQLPSR